MLLNREKNNSDGIYFQAWKNLFESTTKSFWLYNQSSQDVSRHCGPLERLERRKEWTYGGNFFLETAAASTTDPARHGAGKAVQQFAWNGLKASKGEQHGESNFRSTSASTASIAAAAAAAAAAKKNQPYLLTEGKKCFQCPQCKYATDRKNNLKRHLGTMHRDCGKVLQCCDSIFSSKAALRDHIFAVHRAGYRCQHCGRSFCRKALLKRHEMGHDAAEEEEEMAEEAARVGGRARKQTFHQDLLIGNLSVGSGPGGGFPTGVPPLRERSLAQVQKMPNSSYGSSPRAVETNRGENVFFQTVNIFQHLERQFLVKSGRLGPSAGQTLSPPASLSRFTHETSDSHDSDFPPRVAGDRPFPTSEQDLEEKVGESFVPRRHRKLFLTRRLHGEESSIAGVGTNLKLHSHSGGESGAVGRILVGDSRRMCRNVYRCSVCKSEFDSQMKLADHQHK